MSDWEMWLIDACAMLAGCTVLEFYERGELGHYTAIIEMFDEYLYEFDFITCFMDGWDEDDIVDEFEKRLRELVGQFDA